MKRLIKPMAWCPVVFIIILCLISCKKECCDRNNPECDNYAPCYNFKEANADFTINELLQVGNDTLESETDTILNINGVLLKPKYPNQKITWILGNEQLEQKTLYRTNVPIGSIDVTMIAEIDSTPCAVNKKTKDTVHKRFFVQYMSDSDTTSIMRLRLFGTWQGYNTDDPGNQFKLSFGYIRIFYPGPMYRAYPTLAGLPKGCPSQHPFYQDKNPVMDLNYNTGFKAQIIKSRGSHSALGGFNIYAKCRIINDRMVIDYSYNDKPYQNFIINEKEIIEPVITVNKKWIGNKISGKVLPL